MLTIMLIFSMAGSINISIDKLIIPENLPIILPLVMVFRPVRQNKGIGKHKNSY